METGNPSVIRRINRDAILRLLRQRKSCSRAALAKQLKLAPATVSAVVGELIRDNLVVETGILSVDQRSPGRPSRGLKLNPEAGYVFGVVLDTADSNLTISAMWSDYAGNMSQVHDFLISSELGEADVVSSITKVIFDLKNKLSKDANIIATAMGIPGVVVGDEIRYAPRLPGLLGERFHRMASAKLGNAVFLENNVNLALYSEAKAQPALRTSNYGYLLVSEGVGSGISLANNIWKSQNWSGEIGHIRVPLADRGLQTLESIIGLNGICIEGIKRLGGNFQETHFDIDNVENVGQIESLIQQYVTYLLIAIQALNAAVGLDDIILSSRETGFLRYIQPMVLKQIEQSPLKLAVSISDNPESSLTEGAALFGLSCALQAFEHRKTLS